MGTVKYVVLLRVSTQKQSSTGNGIEAQRRDINLFLQHQLNPQVVTELVEVESGAETNRPVLEESLRLCRHHKATLLVQKVDRLSRDLERLAQIVKMKDVPVRVACLPNADNFQIHLFGCLAAQEREFCSQRTRSAMASAKARGVKFGNPKLAELNRSRKNQAKKAANSIAPIVLPLRQKGMTLQEIADTLNSMGIKTATGKNFFPTQVKRVIERRLV
jgi:DNA invertase Pin-like site-specific DNA recombinase